MHAYEFLGPEHSQGLEQFRTDLVLPSVSTGQAQKRGPDPEPPAHLGQNGVVLIVGVGRDVKQRARRREAPQRQAEAGQSLVLLQLRQSRGQWNGEYRQQQEPR